MVSEKILNRKGLLRSKVHYDAPENDTNMSRELLKAFERHRERILLVDSQTGSQFTGERLLSHVGRIATNLIRQIGIKPNDVILTLCDGSCDEVLIALGIAIAGGALFFSTSSDGYEEAKTLCEIVNPQVIITYSRLHQSALALKKNVDNLQNTRIIWLDNPMKKINTLYDENNNNSNNNDDSTYYMDLIETGHVVLYEDLVNGPIDMDLLYKVSNSMIKPKEHILTYMLTSGSTGRPKIVPSTHEELIHGICSMLSACKNLPKETDGIHENGYDLNDCHNHNGEHDIPIKYDDRLLMVVDEDSVLAGDLPLDHGAGANTIFLSLIVGSKFIVIPPFDADRFWQYVHDYSITTSYSSTTFTYKLLLKLKTLIDTNDTKKWNLSSFKQISCAGSKLVFTDLVDEVKKVYKHISVRQCYGCTEIGFIATLNGVASRTHLHSVGYLYPGLIAKVIDRDTGKLLGPNKKGELLLWSNSKFKRYVCEKNLDSEKIFNDCHDEDGFYMTGDQVHYDENERFYIHGRFKDTLFLDTDWKILPAELEDLVNEHPLVEYSSIVGVPNKELPGCHWPKAFIKLISASDSNLKEFEKKMKNYLKSNNDADDSLLLKDKLLQNDRQFIAKHIYKFVAQRCAEPKHLRGGVRILDEFPRNGLLGKIDKKALKLID